MSMFRTTCCGVGGSDELDEFQLVKLTAICRADPPTNIATIMQFRRV